MIVFFLPPLFLFSQENRAQYPGFLKNSYFNFNFGYINFPFSSEQLEPGYQAESVTNHHFGMRLIFFGHQFNKNLAAQVSYMKPLQYAIYNNVNGDKGKHSVWMHSGTLSLKGQVPVSKKISAYGEGGLAIFSRRGFKINDEFAVKDFSYSTVLLGAGLEYHLHPKWGLLANFSYAPGNSEHKQPHELFYSAGVKYNLTPVPDEIVKRNAASGYIFPKNILQFGYSTNALGYGPNNFLSKKMPIFWGGGIEIEKGFTLRYQKNIFHTRKVFSFDAGISAGYWRSKEKKEDVYTFSIFPTLRFTAVRSKPADIYLFYSVAGPSYISKTIVDEKDSGKHFTFQDFMGFGGFLGNQKKMNAEISINHYSNGNIFVYNRGFKIPLTFTVGYTF
ncbi:MAG TPA: acyloxyacyl hydrolase [Flavisolibacter sp.]|nr:acyloxyacyl hydrolase [Flavisolibacter sp.]